MLFRYSSYKLKGFLVDLKTNKNCNEIWDRTPCLRKYVFKVVTSHGNEEKNNNKKKRLFSHKFITQKEIVTGVVLNSGHERHCIVYLYNDIKGFPGDPEYTVCGINVCCSDEDARKASTSVS